MEVAEEALALLKRLDASAWIPYVMGTLLFLWSLLWFWAYMSRNAHAATRLGEFSLLLALAYLAMKVCHAHFFSRLMAELQDDPSPSLGSAWLGRAVLYQALLQPAALVAVPAALLFTVPYPFAASFFQSAQWVRPGDAPGGWLSRSSEMARLWPRQNAWLHLFLAAASVCVAANLFTAIVVGPFLLKSLLGVDTVFNRTDAAFLNTTVLAMTAALAWAVIDPLKKAMHAWRCFHGVSRRTGLDLDLELARLKAGRGRSASALATGTAIVICLLGGIPAGAAPAGDRVEPAYMVHPGQGPAAIVPALDPERLDRLLRDEIGESRYGWRLPRGKNEVGEKSWLRLQLRKFLDWAETGLERAKRWAKRVSDWINRLLLGGNRGRDGSGSEAASLTRIRILMVALAALFAAALAVLLVRRSRRGPVQAAAASPTATPSTPDVSRDDAKADDFAEDEWLALVESLRAQGEDRLALRALFLATLSMLARKGWLTVARHKGNRDYLREVSARARRRQGVADAFGENCRRFNRVWYGRHPVTVDDWDVCRANFESVRAHAS